MKITSYIPLVCVVALTYFGFQYASYQTTTMRMLVDARTGFGSEPSGMVLTNKNLDSEAATIAKSRADALKVNEEARVMMNKATEDLHAAQSTLEEHTAQRDAALARLEEAKATFAEIKEQNDRVLAAMHNIPQLQNAELTEAVGILENTVKEFNDDYDRIINELDKTIKQREKLGQEIGELTVDLTNKLDTNKRFLDNYRRNNREFIIEAVDPRWHFVIFNAPEDSGLYAGDSEPLLVKRGATSIITLRVVSVSGGKVVAEYDEKALPPGMQLEVGDQVIRLRPFGT